MKIIVSIKDVVDEMDVLSDEHSAFLNRNTGKLITLSDEELSAAEEDDNIINYPFVINATLQIALPPI